MITEHYSYDYATAPQGAQDLQHHRKTVSYPTQNSLESLSVWVSLSVKYPKWLHSEWNPLLELARFTHVMEKQNEAQERKGFKGYGNN